jgi:hypothetical protein
LWYPVNALNNPPNNNENAMLPYTCGSECAGMFVITVRRYINELKSDTKWCHLPKQTGSCNRLTQMVGSVHYSV